VRTGAGRQQERPRERDVAVREAHLLGAERQRLGLLGRGAVLVPPQRPVRPPRDRELGRLVYLEARSGRQRAVRPDGQAPQAAVAKSNAAGLIDPST